MDLHALATDRQTVNWTRKLWHVVGGLVTFFVVLYLGWPWTFLAAVATLLTWISIESARRREPWFGRLFFTLSAPFVRHYERRRVVGNTWFALSATLLSVVIRDPIILAAAFIGWTFGDPAAEVFGKLIPSKKYFDDEKSVAGTIACFAVSFLAYLAFFRLLSIGGEITAAAFTGAAATTLAETFSLRFTVNDNFSIPLVSALALSYVLV